MTEDQTEATPVLGVVTVWATRPRGMDDLWYPFLTAMEAACTAAASEMAGRWSSGPPAGQPSVCLAFTIPGTVRDGLRDELTRVSADFGGVPLTWVEGTAELIPAGPEPPPAP